MLISGSDTGSPAQGRNLLSIWDSQYLPTSKSFALFRETICEIYMPWSPERTSDAEFQARIETASMGTGSITRHRCSPHLVVRTARDIANSASECCYLVHLLSGQMDCAQDDDLIVARPGDIVLIDSSRKTKLRLDGTFDALVVTVPKTDLKGANEHRAINALLSQERTPLAKCLQSIGEIMPSASPEEMAGLYQAVCALLPVEAGYFESDRPAGEQRPNINYLLKSILGHIDQNIANTELTPHQVADQFGISVRYVHKLFGACGMTFRSYATARRLDNVCKDLVSPASRREPVSAVAFRWGFNDLSSFNRAFKSRYGCTPSQFRHRAGQ